MRDVESSSTPLRRRRRTRVGLRVLPSLIVPVVVATVVASWSLFPLGAGADPVSNSQNHLNQVNNQLHNAQAQAAQIEDQLQTQGDRLDVLAQQYETDQQQVQQLGDQLTAVKAQIVVTEAKVAATQLQLRTDVLQSYMSGATADSLDGLFSYGGEDAEATQEYERVAGANLSDALDALHQAQQQLSAQQSQLQSTESQAEAVTTQAQAAEQQAAQVAAQQQGELQNVKGQVAQLMAEQEQAKQALAAAVYQQRLAAEAAAASRAVPGGADVAVSPGAAGAVQAAESQLGVPYVWGGESPKGSPDPGFDCSGLTQWSWGQAGVALPRTAAEQYDAIPHVSLSDLEPGDLLFWDDGTSSVEHVGMYVGGGDVIDAPQTGEVVQIQPIWTNGLVGAGRP